MAVASNTNGYLRRTTNLPVNGTGWTGTAWVRMTGNAPAPYAQFFGVGTGVPAAQYIDIGVNGGGTAMILEKDNVGTYNSVAMFTLTLNAWYFVALKTLSATSVQAFWRAQNDVALSTTGSFGVDDLTWTEVFWMADNTPLVGPFEARAGMLWHAALSDADILAQSFNETPLVTSGLDSNLPMASAASAGDDISANNRDWTVLGTFGDVFTTDSTWRRRAELSEPEPGGALPRRLRPLAAFGGAPPVADAPPGRRARNVSYAAVSGDLVQRHGLSFAAVALGAPISIPGPRRRAVGDAGRLGVAVFNEAPLRRVLSLAAAAYVPPVPGVPSARRRLDVRRNRARVR